MAHLLLLEAPGGNDFTLLEDAVAAGHQVSFFTGDLAQYESQGEPTRASLRLAKQVVEVRPFGPEALERRALALHAETPFDAVLCILDIRIVAAARLARALGLRFLDPATASLTRDKFRLRQTLARHGVRQPDFALAETAEELAAAVAAIGFPALVKPVDGYASQNVSVLFDQADLTALAGALARPGREPADYGLGVRASGRFAVERYVRGPMIGCDVFVGEGGRVVLGINDKLLFPPPSFAFRGSCFPSVNHDSGAIAAYAFEILDAIGFDFGACHIEMILAADGPHLVEVNPRLVSAQIPHQMGYALGRSVYLDLIDLHLGREVTGLAAPAPSCFSAIRWLAADRPGRLAAIDLPERPGPEIRRVVLFKSAGDEVRPPLSNGDRIGYVIAVGATQAAAEAEAEQYLRACLVTLD